MSFDSSGIAPLQFVKVSDFSSRWEISLDNIAKNMYVRVWLAKKKPITSE